MKTTLIAAAAALLIVATVVVAGLTNEPTDAQDTGKPVALQDIRSKVVVYKDGDTECEGFAAWDEGVKGKRPVVLIVHDWMGRGEFDEARAPTSRNWATWPSALTCTARVCAPPTPPRPARPPAPGRTTPQPCAHACRRA